MNENLDLFFDTLVIQSDGEIGFHVYYKDYDKEFSFYTSCEKLDLILEDIYERVQKGG